MFRFTHVADRGHRENTVRLILYYGFTAPLRNIETTCRPVSRVAEPWNAVRTTSRPPDKTKPLEKTTFDSVYTHAWYIIITSTQKAVPPTCSSLKTCTCLATGAGAVSSGRCGSGNRVFRTRTARHPYSLRKYSLSI